MHSKGQYMKIIGRPDKEVGLSASDDFMMVDDGDDDWITAHDVRINGQIIEYTGNGEHIDHIGLAQAKSPLTTTNHYFEIEILESRQRCCYVAIGLLQKHCPLPLAYKHWNHGSIAYHADDGNIFVGRGQGTPFGPRCYRGDVMGCGIQYPVEYVTPSDDEDTDDEDIVQQPGEDDDDLDNIDILNDDLGGIDNDWRHLFRLRQFQRRNIIRDIAQRNIDNIPLNQRRMNGLLPPRMDFPFFDNLAAGALQRQFQRGRDRDVGMYQLQRMFLPERGGDINGREQPAAIHGHKDGGMMVKVFFTKNGNRIGEKEVMMPKGGFYPAIMMSGTNQTIKVNFQPLSG